MWGDTHTVTAINGSAVLVGTQLSGEYGTLHPQRGRQLHLHAQSEQSGAPATGARSDRNGRVGLHQHRQLRRLGSNALTITVTGTLHAPTLNALAPSVADDDAQTPLTISAASAQGGTVTVTVSGIPAGATLTDQHGNSYSGNSVTLTTDQLPGLTLQAGTAQVGSTVTLAVQAQVTDGISIADSRFKPCRSLSWPNRRAYSCPH